MAKTIRKAVFVFASAHVLAGCLSAAPLLYSIAGDVNGIGRTLKSIDTSTAVSSPVFELGTGDLSFNGGLVFRPDVSLFYGIANDSGQNSSLISFSLSNSGTFNTLFSVGVGFNGGLAFREGENAFYAIGNDVLGASTLYRLNTNLGTASALFGIGDGFLGGLAYNSSDHQLYALASDSLGNSRLEKIDPENQSITEVGSLGQGFRGGLVFDSSLQQFYGIASDRDGQSTLHQISALGNATPLFGIGQGYDNAGVALIPEAIPIPEPSATHLLTAIVFLVSGWKVVQGLRVRLSTQAG